MKLMKKWIQNIKSKWITPNNTHLDEDFEITEFDHTPFIDEALKVSQ